MKWDNFKKFFHPSWHEKIKPFIESSECDKIYAFLKAESKRGAKIAPLSQNVFRCFEDIPLDEIRVVVLGAEPYTIFNEDTPLADGFGLGCSQTAIIPKTLREFYNGIENELYNGMCLDCLKENDMTYLARIGVLMLNSSLTVEKDKPNSHIRVWDDFMAYLCNNVFNELEVPFILLGKNAALYEGLIKTQNVFLLKHPSTATSKIAWDTKGVFKKVNEIVLKQSGYTVDWLNNIPF